MSGKLSVLIVKTVVEDADLMKQPADMIGMLRRVGRSLGRNDKIVRGQVDLVAIEITAQNRFEAGFADGNLNPVGVDVTLEGLHHAEKMPLRAEETLGIVNGGSDDGGFHCVSRELVYKVKRPTDKRRFAPPMATKRSS